MVSSVKHCWGVIKTETEFGVSGSMKDLSEKHFSEVVGWEADARGLRNVR